ncbi:MAG: hypothetical protein QG670_132 [Thermoproteota archaeon]|nr:hypothetical protein [Thermoproteota archaeon]
MSEEHRCPKCNGKMKAGQLYVTATFEQPVTRVAAAASMNPLQDMGMTLQGLDVNVEGPSWREETDTEEGWLLKRKGKRVLPIKGMRCLECGYIEFYVVK